MQPYFFPYIGYYQLINYVDTHIIYDDVNYIKSGWINRNYILSNNSKNEKQRITLKLNKISSFKHINEITIIADRQKLLKQIFFTYSKAPFFSTIFPIIKEILLKPETNLARFLFYTIKQIISYLEIDTRLIVSSEIKKNIHLAGQDKILHICKLYNADEYVNAVGGKELYRKEKFLKQDIHLKFLKTGNIQYKQFNNEFVPNLSIIDALMFNSKTQLIELISNFELI